MIARLRRAWEKFSDSAPGSRFKDFYYRRRERQGYLIVRVFLVIFGAVLALGSLFTAPLPGPGFATVFLGLAILAGEFLPAARFLDWAEVRLRKFGRFIEGVWNSGTAGKLALAAAVAVLIAAFAGVVYLILFAR